MTEREMARKKAAARKERARKARNRRVVTTVALMLVVCIASIGGTIAWLTDTTGEVVNTFSPSDITLTLTESQNLDFKMVPGDKIKKDPVVSITTDVNAWLFVEVMESDNLDDFIAYSLRMDGWTAGTKTAESEGNGVPANVIFREVAAGNGGTKASYSYYLLTGEGDDEFKNGFVTVNRSVTKAMMNALHGDIPADETAGTGAQASNKPTLSFKAYAIQKDSFDTAKAAWNELNPASGT